MTDELQIKADQQLRRYWGFESFKPGQREAVDSVLKGISTLVLFPTGGGKSLCYQLPATLFDGMTLVISPLVALMQDQVQKLNDLGIKATFINSTLHYREVEQRLVNARNGMYKLLYCAPERLKTDLWKAELPNLNIDLVAVDEAHCISEWGHDFRPSYREIVPSLEPIADSVGWVALTATATPEVREDIINNLQFNDPAVVARGFDRPNLKWWVLKSEQKQEKVLHSVKRASRKGSGIVYGGTRKNCEHLAESIETKLGLKCRAYHAGIDTDIRRQLQQDWLDGELPLVAATNAFGMGIDKDDCRYVIHYEMPYSLESYYQEAGRAGRDGRESYAVLLYNPSDGVKAEKRIRDSYPRKQQLQKTYDALCDTLNLAVGSEMDRAEQVPLEAVRKRSGLPLRKLRAGLKLLDRLGVIQLMEYVKPMIGIYFQVSEDFVRRQVQTLDNEKKSFFLDTLFRQFGQRAFEEMTYRDLDYLKHKLDTTSNGVIKGLQVLQNHDHLLRYESTGEMPLVRLLDERVAKLQFTRAELEKHRDNLLRKVEHMIGYIQTDRCREEYIRRYFGEQEVEPCGHCDNCMDIHEEPADAISSSEIDTLKGVLSESPKSISEIKALTNWNSRKIKQSLSFLIREQRVETESDKYQWKE